jgi:hypothetical protein
MSISIGHLSKEEREVSTSMIAKGVAIIDGTGG